jgi:hypothetical protein
LAVIGAPRPPALSPGILAGTKRGQMTGGSDGARLMQTGFHERVADRTE